MPALPYMNFKYKLEWVGECRRICNFISYVKKSPRSLKSTFYKVEELWNSTINLRSDNHRNGQPCCYHVSAYVSESHQAISSAGVRTAEWHWKAKILSLPLGAWTLALIGMVISVTQKGAIWLPNLDWEWELACLSLLLKALTALNINLVQLASQPELLLQKF